MFTPYPPRERPQSNWLICAVLWVSGLSDAWFQWTASGTTGVSMWTPEEVKASFSHTRYRFSQLPHHINRDLSHRHTAEDTAPTISSAWATDLPDLPTQQLRAATDDLLTHGTEHSYYWRVLKCGGGYQRLPTRPVATTQWIRPYL